MISGVDLELVYGGDAASARFWPAVLRLCTSSLESLVRSSAIPLEDSTAGFLITFLSADVQVLVRDLGECLHTANPGRNAYAAEF